MPVAKGPLELSLLLLPNLPLFLAPEIRTWKHISGAVFRPLLALYSLENKELWADLEGRSRVEQDFYAAPEVLTQKPAFYNRIAPSVTDNAFSTCFCAGSVVSYPANPKVVPPSELHCCLYGRAWSYEKLWPWRFGPLQGQLLTPITPSLVLRLAWGWVHTVGI